MATLPVDANSTPNYTPAQHADFHNTLQGFFNVQNVVTANRQTGNYTLVIGDISKVIEMNVAGANTLTVPPNSSVAFEVGTVIEVMQYGAGQTTITPGSGVTLRTAGDLTIADQYGTVALRKIATDEWHVVGALGAAPAVTVLGYAQVVADQTGITTEASLTGLSVTVSVTAGHKIKITGHVRAASAVSQDVSELRIKETTTVLALDRVSQANSSGLKSLHSEVVLTAPSAGSHTYHLTLLRDSGSGTYTMSAGATYPAFILVEDLGA